MLPDQFFQKSPLIRLMREIDQMIDQSFQRFAPIMPSGIRHQETSEAHHLFLAFPSQIKEEQISVRIYPSLIHIITFYEEKNSFHDERNNHFSYSKGSQHYVQSIPLPPHTNYSQITTKITDHELHIIIPKAKHSDKLVSDSNSIIKNS